eukprot:TRINITY_DN3721_c1_g1_i1.p1 TRINITY_DN3721_c1_g1~~TRINITY_DN3721_c1_g1_i1.p1  ORF type:complete len:454 (+),score=88.75 TRINITY_DN3721_c1_g1_i1:87-1364(+)
MTMETVILPFEISLKVSYPWGAKDGHMITRRVRLSNPSYQRMKETIKELGGESEPCIMYVDNEGDNIVIGSALEWHECIRLFATTSPTAGTVKIFLTRSKVRLPTPSINFEHVAIDDRWDEIISILQNQGIEYPPVSNRPLSVSWINKRDGYLHISRRKLKELMNQPEQINQHIDVNATTTEVVATASQVTDLSIEVGTGTDIPATCTMATSTVTTVATIGSQISQTCAEVAVGTFSPSLKEAGSCTTAVAFSTATTGSQISQSCSEMAVGTQSPSLKETGSCTIKTIYSDTACETVVGEGSHDAGVGTEFRNTSVSTETEVNQTTTISQPNDIDFDEDSYSDGALDDEESQDSELTENYSSDFGTESSGVQVDHQTTGPEEDMISKIKRLRTLGITASDEVILSMLEETKGDVSLALCALLENF